LGCISTHAYG